MPSKKGKPKRSIEGPAAGGRSRRKPADTARPVAPTPEEEPRPPAPAPAEAAARPGPAIVGIGASAGGLDAFRKLLTAMPADSGVALVLVPHLDPQHESMMVELLTRHTSMPVVEAAEGMVVEPDHVYVIPPNKYITIHDGILRLTGPVERGGAGTSLDVFLRSLADDQHERAVCVILSGTGTRGALGLKAVKAAGGMAMVQDPATAAFPQMPRSAAGSGLADYVLPVEQMPAALIAYVRHRSASGESAIAQEAEASDGLDEIIAILRTGGNLDFRPYRKRMLARRVRRRMSLNNIDSVSDYATFLRAHPEEVRRMCSDLLISVTSFFRDQEAWRLLETEVIAPIVDGRDTDAPIRAWCPGCATGDEAYSLGMLFLERLAAAHRRCPVQIFATDADEDTLDVASLAVYPDTIAADVSPERLARFFTRVSDTSYQVGKQLREAVTFARQNLLTDAPFSKLDLIVCRNLLIYLDPEAQQRIMAIFHFGLADGGYLFLGSSETIGKSLDLFEPISSKWRIYRRLGAARAVDLQFPIMQIEASGAKPGAPARAEPVPKLAETAQDLLLRRFALACVVINRQYQVVHFAGPAEDYLVQPGGPPTRDLLSLARPGLETKLRGAIQRAIRENAPQSVKDVMMRHAGHTRRVHIGVEPLNLSKQTHGLLLVAFHEQPAPSGETLAEARARGQTADTDLVRRLEQELGTTREDLQSTIEELESSNEELKASNEELETSKEELQSLNEELGTVNNQLAEKVNDLEAANNDIANLLNCTEIATIFLDRAFRIKRYTPAATRLFNLIPGDAGRPIGDIVKKFTDDDLLADAERFLRDLVAREQEVRTDDGRWCVRRILPYRTTGSRIDGVVVTFVDITERKQAADEVLRRLAAIVESSADAIFHKDLHGTVRSWNKGAERLYGFTADEMIGQSISKILPDDCADEWADYTARLLRGEHIQRLETERLHKDGRRIAVALSISPMCDDSGKVVSAAVIARDITERKLAERALRDSEARFRALTSAISNVIYSMSPDWTEMRHLEGREFIADTREPDRTWLERYIHPDDRQLVMETIHRAIRTKSIFELEHRVIRTDGTLGWTHSRAIPILDAHGAVVEWFGAAADVTSRKQAEERLRESEDRLRAILETAVDSVITIDERGTIQSVNPATVRAFGYAEAEMIGKNVSMLMPSPYHDEHDSYLARYMKTGEKRIIGIGREVEARRKDGSTFPIDLAVSEVIPGKLFTGVIRDISERKRAAVQLQHADRLASIGTLAAGLGHDMNNVLLPVRAHLNALRAAKKPPLVIPEGRKHIDEVAKSVSYLQQLADGLHFLAMDPDLDEDARGGGDTTDLRQWWSQAGVLIAKGVPKHVRVTASIPDSLPRAVVAAHALTQAVLNLVVNAGDAIPPTKERKRRQGHVRVWARSDPGEGVIRLGVTDNGRGMTEEVRRRAFEMFFTTKVRGLGTGLGLALVKRVAKSVGGHIEVESQVGKGTTITMVFKAAVTPSSHAAASPIAVVTLRDGRAAALARHILEAAGASVLEAPVPDHADLWMLDPEHTEPRQAKKWRDARPDARLVLFGTPSQRDAKAWEALRAVVIKKRDDFDSLKSTLGGAIAGAKPR